MTTRQMRHAEHHLAGGLDAPAEARRLVGAWAKVHPRRDEIVLAVSEIVANAVTHGAAGSKGGLTLRLESDRGRLRVVVAHAGASFTPKGRPDDLAGLQLVDRAVDRWGIDGDTDRVAVWFEIDSNLSAPAAERHDE